MHIRRLVTFFSLIMISLMIVSCTEDQIPSKVEDEINKITGTILNEDGSAEAGANVQLKVANYNPIFRSAVNYDQVNCRGLREDPEVLEFETTTDSDGNYSFTDVPAGVYSLSAKDTGNKKAAHKPNIKISDNDSTIGVDTLKGYIEITIHVPDSYVSENSFFYIPGTDIYFHISKAGTMYIQVPVGLISLVFCEDSDLFLETLFLIIKNLLVNDSTIVEKHEIYKPEFLTIDTTLAYSTKDTVYFYVRVNSSEDHPLEYRFMWGDSIWSDWTYESKDIPKVFTYPGSYVLFAQARCAIDTSVISELSNPINVFITDSIISQDWINPPEYINGLWSMKVGEYGWYDAGFASSNATTEFEYQFNWGDGTYSSWISDTLIYANFDSIPIMDSVYDTLINGVSEYHVWYKAGGYSVTVRARSAYDSTLVSDWSYYGMFVNVYDINVPDLPTPYIWGPDNLMVNEKGTFNISAGGPVDTNVITCVVNWGDGTNFVWTGVVDDSMSYQIKHSYQSAGYYMVKAMIMDAYDSSITSEWSDSLFVNVTDSGSVIMPRPNMPQGDSVIYISEISTYYSNGFSSSISEDSIQFRFDWGDSMSISNWIDGEYVAENHAWYYPGYYQVRCQARSVLDTNNISEWSYPLWVEVVDTMINDTVIIDTIIHDTIIVIDTIINDSGNVIIDTIFTDTSFIDTSYLIK